MPELERSQASREFLFVAVCKVFAACWWLRQDSKHCVRRNQHGVPSPPAHNSHVISGYGYQVAMNHYRQKAASDSSIREALECLEQRCATETTTNPTEAPTEAGAAQGARREL